MAIDPHPGAVPGPSHPERVSGWVHGLEFPDLPDAVVARARALLLDTLGVAAAGGATPAAGIAYDLAAEQFAAGEAPAAVPLPFDGRPVSASGAAYALATRIDSLDAHDGYQPAKGHAGVALVPALLALGQAAPAPAGRTALAALVAGYEVAARAGTALHASTPDYHSSGAWNALGVAALGARLRGFGEPRAIARALGIAEYHAPRAPMLREIDAPSMLHDSSGWGALAGTAAVLLTERGFSSSPAELPRAEGDWSSLGEQWLILEQYVKPHPVCYWAQPAVRAGLALRSERAIDPARIRRVRIETFHEATRLHAEIPPTTEVAQYALAFPVAAALTRGRLGPAEITRDGLDDPAIGDLVGRIEVVENAQLTQRFPAERLAVVTVERDDGVVFQSEPTQPYGVPDDPMDDAAIRAKFHDYAASALGAERTAALAAAVDRLSDPGADLTSVADLVRDDRHDWEPGNAGEAGR